MAEKLKNRAKLTRKICNLVASLVALGLIGVYVWQVGLLMQQKYQIRNLANKIGKLQIENQALKIEVAHLQSASRLREFALKLGMSPVASLVYLPVYASEVALKK